MTPYPNMSLSGTTSINFDFDHFDFGQLVEDESEDEIGRVRYHGFCVGWLVGVVCCVFGVMYCVVFGVVCGVWWLVYSV